MAGVRDARIAERAQSEGWPRTRGWVVPLVAAVAVVLLAGYFLQHFPLTLLAFALLLLAVGRLDPIAREVIGIKRASVIQSCFDFAGLALVALAATQGALGEIARAFAALLHG